MIVPHVLQAYGIALPGDRSPSPPPVASDPGNTAQDLPALVKACLGVAGRSTTLAAPFVTAATVSDMVKVATTAGGPYSRGTGSQPAAAGRLAQAMVLEGLLGVLLVAGGGRVAAVDGGSSGSGGVGGGGGGGGDDDALASVQKEGVSLLLAAFAGLGEGRAADRLWRDCGAPVLESLVAAGGRGGFGGGGGCGQRLESSSETTAEEETETTYFSSHRRCSSIWRDFSDGAVERTRLAMEGEGNNGDGTLYRGPSPPQEEGAERAATLASALVELQSTLRQRQGQKRAGGGVLSEEMDDVPVLWRLGLTRPSIWRQLRLEVLALARAAGEGSEDGAAAATPAAAEAGTWSAGDFARACIGSRYARRQDCVSLVLARLPDARARLSLLVEGVAVTAVATSAAVAAEEGAGVGAGGGVVGVAGAALQEIVAAGVVLSRAQQLLGGESYRGGMATGGDAVPVVDLPSCLLVPALANQSTDGESGGGGGAARAAGSGGGVGGVDQAEEFGVGLPSFRGFLPAAGMMDQPVAVAAAASAEVLDAAMVHLSSRDQTGELLLKSATVARKAGEVETSAVVADRSGSQEHQYQHQHPFSLLLPQGLWRVAFESPTRPAPAEEDVRLHGVLVAALHSSVQALAELAAALKGRAGGEAGAWRVSCSAEISTGLLVAVVGEAFVRGFRLGDDANRSVCVYFCLCVCCCV